MAARLKPATTVSARMTYALPCQNGPRSTRDEFWHQPSARASFLAISGLSRHRPTLSAFSFGSFAYSILRCTALGTRDAHQTPGTAKTFAKPSPLMSKGELKWVLD